MWDAPWHWVVLAIIVIALFGYKKLPDASRALGRSLRIFKSEIKGMTEDDNARAKADSDDEEPKSLQAPAEPKAISPAAENAAATPTETPVEAPVEQEKQRTPE
jgi:sec-independent protein translocase protein TatA